MGMPWCEDKHISRGFMHNCSSGCNDLSHHEVMWNDMFEVEVAVLMIEV